MKAFRLIDATLSDYSDLQNMVESNRARSDSYIAYVCVKNKELIITNCCLICEEYAKRGGRFTYIDLDNFESMTV